MNILNKSVLLLIVSSFIFSSCEKTSVQNDNIFYSSLNKEYVLITDTETLLASDDEISDHVDSIINGLIDEGFISTGEKKFDLDLDEKYDIGFEIIDLNLFNDSLPETLDSLAARVLPVNIQILDNSTYGYPDALIENENINEEGNWTDQTCVLGTFMNAGQFQGAGERYLAFRLPNDPDYNYGWIKIYCSEHNDTLKIIEYAYNNTGGNTIKAGQKE